LRETPTWRIPVGVLALVVALGAYGIAVASLVPPLIGGWNALAQTPIYVVLGIVWILPLKRYLIWMETGRWRMPAPESESQ
jgi:predicted membrane channel-forming protein YqfA (hemolysin III family)